MYNGQEFLSKTLFNRVYEISTLFVKILSRKNLFYTEYMIPYQTAFIENLKYYRNKKEISQAKLAELCECGTGTIGSIESARQFPSFDLLFRMAEVLKVHPADLFLRDSSKNNAEIRAHIEHILQNGLKELLEKEFLTS